MKKEKRTEEQKGISQNQLRDKRKTKRKRMEETKGKMEEGMRKRLEDEQR